MKSECVSLPKTKAQLSQLHDDDEDVFATSLTDRYASKPKQLANMSLAVFLQLTMMLCLPIVLVVWMMEKV